MVSSRSSSILDSDSEGDWEEVDVPKPEEQHIEITLNARPKNSKNSDEAAKKRAASLADRQRRVACHKLHTVCLLLNARIRNDWTNDELLHARLLSLTPLSLQDAFAVIHKSRIPDQSHRGHLFEGAISQLVDWWSQSYFQVESYGHIRNRTFDHVQSQVAPLSFDELMEALKAQEDVEIIRGPKSLMKHALTHRGSRDVSAQLFTALCRAIGIPARLVVSLQSVPWQSSIGKANPGSRKKKTDAGRTKGKGKDTVVEPDDEDQLESVEVSTPDIKGKGKAREVSVALDLDRPAVHASNFKVEPVIRLRKQRSKVQSSSSFKRQATPDPTTSPPVFWTEVYSRPDARWLPVDPIRNIVNKRKLFDPTHGNNERVKKENRLLYVLAFEEDGYARDVTPRYAKDYGAKVAKAQEVGGGARRRRDWWEQILNLVRRPYRLARDDVEDEELQVNQMMEGMPTSMAGFKDHPLYVLGRHLKRDEIVHPLVEIGKFRGEPVYARSAVISLKTAENWMRIGRKVKPGCQPMKWVKPRAATVNKRREVEMALEINKSTAVDDNVAEDVMQGLYALSQTEMYQPDPIIDGKIPKNEFGNIDLYVPSMLPAGAVHIPFKGVAKIAKTLGFDYAEAVTGFEFRKRRAFPVIEGVVVSAEIEEMLLEAYLESEQDAEEKARLKRQARVIKSWTRLIQGLRIRQRLQEEYADKAQPVNAIRQGEVMKEVSEAPKIEGGGFVIGADEVVLPFHLPRPQFHAFDSPASTGTPAEYEQDRPLINNHAVAPPEFGTFAMETMDDDQVVHSVTIPINNISNGTPKTMREIAEDAARKQDSGEVLDDDDFSPSTPSSSTPVVANDARPKRTRAGKVTTSVKKRGRTNSHVTSHDDGPSPSKRGKAIVTLSSQVSSGRVLRPRTAKSANKIREEEEMERAFWEAAEE